MPLKPACGSFLLLAKESLNCWSMSALPVDDQVLQTSLVTTVYEQGSIRALLVISIS